MAKVEEKPATAEVTAEEASEGVPKDHPLCTIRGVGPKTAEKLIEAGLKTPEDVACKRPEELADMLGITKKAARDIVNNAFDMTIDTAVVIGTMQDEIDHRKAVVKRIPTGSSKFDAAIRGGIPTEAITALKGEAESGKSEFCHQLVVNNFKYHGRKAAWISTENMTFSPDRIAEMSKAVNVKIDPNKDVLFVSSGSVASTNKLFLAYQALARRVENEKIDLGLIVIDSFSAPFRKEFGDRSQLPDRAREEGRHLGYLDGFAKKYNCAVVITAQVMDIPDQGSQLGEKAHTGHVQRMWGGNVVRHSITYGISLAQVASFQYEGVIFASPDVAKTAFRYCIKESGIRDV
jgi:RecA/RadA recombinase